MPPEPVSAAVPPSDHPVIRGLLADYLRMYASRDDRLTTFFSDDFSGFTGGGDFLVHDQPAWVAITRQDFAQVKDPIRIELKDVAVQSLSDTVAVATSFFTLHLPMADQVLSRKTARLVLIFRHESAGWKIAHSSISIPYDLVQPGEVYPLQQLTERNQLLEELVAERTAQLSAANEQLRRSNALLEREVSERRQADSALRASEERYRSIVQACPDNITIADRAGRILMVSPVARTMFRHQADDFFGRSILEFVVPEDRARAAAQVARKHQGIVTGPGEYRALRPDGSTFDIEVNSEFSRNAAGEPTGMVVIIRDITSRKQAEAEKERLEAQNRRLQKAESLARMAGAIAHNFNNQLQSVTMGLELAIADSPRDGAPPESLVLALRSARKAAEMSSLMLTYLGQSATSRRRLDLAATCRRALAAMHRVLPSQVVEADLPGAGPIVFADAEQLQQVLANLLTNAWEAGGPAPTAVRVVLTTEAAAEIPAAHRFPVDGQPPEGVYACVTVADAGAGISRKDIDQIFDPFYTSKFAGRGLGLAVVLGIVRSLDGVVTVDSRPGHGSTFRVYLPLAADAPAELRPVVASRSASA